MKLSGFLGNRDSLHKVSAYKAICTVMSCQWEVQYLVAVKLQMHIYMCSRLLCSFSSTIMYSVLRLDLLTAFMFGCSKQQVNHQDFIVLDLGTNFLVGDQQDQRLLPSQQQIIALTVEAAIAHKRITLSVAANDRASGGSLNSFVVFLSLLDLISPDISFVWSHRFVRHFHFLHISSKQTGIVINLSFFVLLRSRSGRFLCQEF